MSCRQTVRCAWASARRRMKRAVDRESSRWHSYLVIFTDEYGDPLPKGTAIDLQPHSPHTGLIGYLPTGEQVVAHNSKQRGRAVVTWPEEFNDFHIPFRIIYYPLFPQDGERIWGNALYDVERGVLWSGGDNCQDFVSRAYTGRNGSPTRDIIFAGLVVVGLAWVGHASSKPNARRRSTRR